jgi:hypothetical protein
MNVLTQVSNPATMEIGSLTDPDGGLNLADGHARASD